MANKKNVIVLIQDAPDDMTMYTGVLDMEKLDWLDCESSSRGTPTEVLCELLENHPAAHANMVRETNLLLVKYYMLYVWDDEQLFDATDENLENLTAALQSVFEGMNLTVEDVAEAWIEAVCEIVDDSKCAVTNAIQALVTGEADV